MSYPSFNVRRGHYRVHHPGYKHRRGYDHGHIRDRARVGQAVVYLRYTYHLSMNVIAQVLDVSTRTVHRKISFGRLINNGFDGASRRRRMEVKIVNTQGRVIGLKTLQALCQSFLHGIFDSIREALGDEPP